MAIFAEGTRLTEAKVQASVEYARANGLPELKHHLLPRSRGFSMTVQYFKDKGKLEFPVYSILMITGNQHVLLL